MILLSVIGGFLVGAWSQHMWGNHRAKYYRKKMKEALDLAAKTQEANRLLVREYEKMREGKCTKATNNMRGGLLDAITDLSKAGL